MTTLKIKINTDNDAFASDGPEDASEIDRVLNQVVIAVGSGLTQGFLRDSNGNTVGHWSWN